MAKEQLKVIFPYYPVSIQANISARDAESLLLQQTRFEIALVI